jgi:predicted HAD superfamily Cof-like phosphohydrolase
MNVFNDQARFMRACGQKVGEWDAEQFELYLRLIREEATELLDAVAQDDKVEMFDAILDLIVVCIGAGHSAGFPLSAGWEAVIKSNMDKVDPETGRVRRRADGKIMKPDGWKSPQEELARLIRISDFLG